MRRTYPYLANPYGGDMDDDAKRKAFFKKVDDVVNQRQYVRLTLLSWDENPLKEVQGVVTSGTMTKDASSSVRRTMSLSLSVDSGSYDAADLDMDFSINKKVFVELGVKNQTGEYPDYPILWFPQGVMFILSCSLTSNATSGVGITLSLKDKMCMLNGDIGGKLPATTIFDEVDTQGPSGEYTAEKVKIHDIITEAVSHFGGENLNNILVEDVDQKIRRVVKWTGDNPLYLIRQADDQADKATYEATLDKPPDTSDPFAEDGIVYSQTMDVSRFKGGSSQDKWTYPEKEGYLFSGWFTDEGGGFPFTDTEGYARARFIPITSILHDDGIVTLSGSSPCVRFFINIPSLCVPFFSVLISLHFEDEDVPLFYGKPQEISDLTWPLCPQVINAVCPPPNKEELNKDYVETLRLCYKTQDGTLVRKNVRLPARFNFLNVLFQLSASSILKDEEKQYYLSTINGLCSDPYQPVLVENDGLSDSYVKMSIERYIKEDGTRICPEPPSDEYTFAGWFENRSVSRVCSRSSGEAFARFVKRSDLLNRFYFYFVARNNSVNNFYVDLDYFIKVPFGCSNAFYKLARRIEGQDATFGDSWKDIGREAFSLKGYNCFEKTESVYPLDSSPDNRLSGGAQAWILLKYVTPDGTDVETTSTRRDMDFIGVARKMSRNTTLPDKTRAMLRKLVDDDYIPQKKVEYMTIAQNDDCGYVYDDFTYIGDLSTGLGDTVTTVLDKLISYMGNYEYFYDEYGIFHFREIKNYVNTTFATTAAESMTANDYLVENTVGKSTYTFTDDSNLVSLTSNPQMNNIKNDYIVQGTRKGTSSEQSYPVRYHLAIDSKPVRTHLDENTGSYTYEPRDNFLIYIDQDTKYKVGIFPVFVGGELPDPGNFNVVYAFEDSDKDGNVSKKFMYVSSSGEYKEVETVAYYNGDPSVVGYPSQVADGYTPKDWRTELYVRGFEAKNNGTDKGYYFEELEAGWPQIYDLEAQEFKGAGDAGTSVSALTDGNSFLDFIDPETSPLGKYSVNSIGRRSDIVNSDDVNCLFQPEIPEVVYVNLQDEDAAEQEGELNAKGEPWCQVKGDVFGGLATGGYKNGAFDQIKYELYTHTNYQRTLSLTALPAFYLEPNTRVTVSDKTSNTFGDFIVKNVTYTLGTGSTMSVTASEAFERF